MKSKKKRALKYIFAAIAAKRRTKKVKRNWTKPWLARRADPGESYRSLSYSFRIAPSTVCSIIPEVCDALYQALKDTYLKEKWSYPNCLGAIDGKHVVVQAPCNSGSYYYNNKQTHSIVLMALVDANYRFNYVDVGKSIENELINFPGPKELHGRHQKVPFVVVGDEAFPMKEYRMKPYPHRGGLDYSQRIFNYRLSRARRIVENDFGILCNRFRVLRAPILSSPDKVEKIVLCCCALYNFLRPETQTANDAENGQDIGTGLLKVPPGASGGSRNSCQARQIRDEFKEYFFNTGQVPWQANAVR
ncbi:unnamed protein product [Mytilus coruscus]|uniref:DDE Tnp4 domain-containing protein n=1 Tax=Mytilus coruscus TaxID=42192 RepID=A0A6J8D790_MYTCO|nr:unnamed protein product [Mytilus coruscus]